MGIADELLIKMPKTSQILCQLFGPTCGNQGNLLYLDLEAVMSQLEVPVVDISGFFTGNAAERSRIAREVAGAVEGIGFLTIVGHGVPNYLMEDVSAAYRSFFDLPLEIKKKYVNQARNTNRGYVPYGDEFVALFQVHHNHPTGPDVSQLSGFQGLHLAQFGGQDQ